MSVDDRPRRRAATVLVNAKTVRLSAGRHHCPEDGVCVMELSSILAGESFSDHPTSVCPMLAAFLRGYNDHLPGDMRQRLFGLAADAVGTRDLRHEKLLARQQLLLELARRLASTTRWWSPWSPQLTGRTQTLKLANAGGHAAKAVARRPHLHDRLEQALHSAYHIDTSLDRVSQTRVAVDDGREPAAALAAIWAHERAADA